MASESRGFVAGLEGVPVAETRLSRVDGARGRLIVGGRDIEDLARSATYEEACALLWAGDEVAPPANGVRAQLGEARVAAFACIPSLGDALRLPDAMDALRAAIAHLHERSLEDHDAVTGTSPGTGDGGGTPPENRAKPGTPTVMDETDSSSRYTAPSASECRGGQSRSELRGAGTPPKKEPTHENDVSWNGSARLTGAVAVFAAAWARLRAGALPVPADPALGHAADYLRMLHGSVPSAEEVRALDAYLVTVIDHGLNASTFAARVVASTGSDLVSAVTAAIGALKGPLHGGAPGPVLDMLDAVQSPERAAEWLGSELSARRRIMGMGHRVYRVRDPRAAVLEAEIERLRGAIEAQGDPSSARVAARLELSRAVEREATALLAARHPNRALRANVEFYTAVLLEAIGVPRELFSATFAAARTAGWTAHVAEERQKGRLIRPTSVYVGVEPASYGESRAG